MNKSLLTELTKLRQGPCVTVIVGTKCASFADYEEIRLKIKASTKLAKNILRKKYKTHSHLLGLHMMSMIEHIDLNSALGGIGLFLSPGFKQLVYFPLEVEEKIVVGESFEVSDLRNTLNKMKDYGVLLLSKNRTRLFLGKGNHLDEITDRNFPARYENEFQVHRDAQYSLYNKEESKIAQTRLRHFFRKIDVLIDEYIGPSPLVLLGVTRYLSCFQKVSKHEKQLIGHLTGNFDKFTEGEIIKLVWPQIAHHLSHQAIKNDSVPLSPKNK